MQSKAQLTSPSLGIYLIVALRILRRVEENSHLNIFNPIFTKV